jgi:hypothetical protein
VTFIPPRLHQQPDTTSFEEIIFMAPSYRCGPGSSVGIATDCGLDGPETNPGGGARFFAHVQTGPGAHPVSCTMGTGYFPGVKRLGRGAGHPPILAPRSRKSRAIPLLPHRHLVACYRVTFTFTFTSYRWQQ